MKKDDLFYCDYCQENGDLETLDFNATGILGYRCQNCGTKYALEMCLKELEEASE